MKTSVIMIRDMNGYSIRQDSKTGMFNANDLIEAYNFETKSNKRVQHYLDNDSSKDLMNEILIDIHNSREVGELDLVIKTKRGKNGGTWTHPYLMVDFGMWLSTKYKLTVIKWFYDNLIQFRIDCGNGFKDVNKALVEAYPTSAHFKYSNEANMINKLVFGNTDKGQRNSATETQLRLLEQLQKADVTLITDGLDYYDRYDKLKSLKRFL